MNGSHLPRPARLFLIIVGIDAALFSLFRALFHLIFAPEGAALPVAVLARAFWIGAKFDVRLAVLLALPLLALGGIRPLSPWSGPRRRRAWAAGLTVVHLGVLIFYVGDLGHYSYTASRINITILQFLFNLATSARMVWESYPVLRGGLGLLLAAYGAWRLFGWLLARAALWPPAPAPRWRRVVAAVAVALLAAAGLYGKLSWYPLRWSDAYFSTETYPADLAQNPVLYFFETLYKDPLPYDLKRVRAAYPLVARFLGVARPDAERLVYARRQAPRAAPAVRPNVVIVILESFASYKTGIFGNPLDPTPRFDALARGGALFTRFYTPTWGTARSVFATVTGLPDVETHKTATRNPLLVTQHTILSDFAGYSKLYFLGGSLNWANIRGLLAHNIAGLQLFEEGSYAAPRVDVWGISDLDLFRESVPVLSRQKTPFVAIVQTSGSHRPYTIPKDSGGFVPRAIGDAEARRHGFVSAAEYNAFRFLDHGVGEFMDLAAREPWFGNTIFAFYGDHGLPGAAPHIPRAEESLLLTRFHVPFLLWGPALVGGARVVESVTSELDVLPTLASLAGVPCLNSTIGRDAFDPAFDAMRYVFTVGDQSSSPQLGLIGKERAFGMFADGSRKTLTALDGGDPAANLLTREPGTAAEMEELCRAIYETARYLPFVNAPGKIREN